METNAALARASSGGLLRDGRQPAESCLTCRNRAKVMKGKPHPWVSREVRNDRRFMCGRTIEGVTTRIEIPETIASLRCQCGARAAGVTEAAARRRRAAVAVGGLDWEGWLTTRPQTRSCRRRQQSRTGPGFASTRSDRQRKKDYRQRPGHDGLRGGRIFLDTYRGYIEKRAMSTSAIAEVKAETVGGLIPPGARPPDRKPGDTVAGQANCSKHSKPGTRQVTNARDSSWSSRVGSPLSAGRFNDRLTWRRSKRRWEGSVEYCRPASPDSNPSSW